MVYHVPVDLYNIQRGNEVEKQRFSSVQNEILKNKLFTVLALTGKKKMRTEQHFTCLFFIYFSDMHLHAYSKASYQTHTNTLCHLHKLQIMSGTSVQN